MEIRKLLEIVRDGDVQYNRREGNNTYFTIPVRGKLYEFPVKFYDKNYITSKAFVFKHLKKAIEEGTFVEYVEKEEENPYIPKPSYQLPLTPELAKEMREILLEKIGDTKAEEKFKEVLEDLRKIEKGESVGFCPAFA